MTGPPQSGGNRIERNSSDDGDGHRQLWLENSANMLGHLCIPCYSPAMAVTMRRVQKISREGHGARPQRLHAEPLPSGRVVI